MCHPPDGFPVQRPAHGLHTKGSQHSDSSETVHCEDIRRKLQSIENFIFGTKQVRTYALRKIFTLCWKLKDIKMLVNIGFQTRYLRNDTHRKARWLTSHDHGYCNKCKTKENNQFTHLNRLLLIAALWNREL